MPRVLLLLPTSTYRAADFVAAATRLGVDVVVGSEVPQAMAAGMGDRAVVVPMSDVAGAVPAIAALHDRSPVDAVVAVDDQGVEVAAAAGAALGLPHNDPVAVRVTRDKAAMRDALARGGVHQPRYRVVARAKEVATAAAAVGFPCVVKPVGLSASRGVIRADDAGAAAAAAGRIAVIASGPLLVEEFVPGAEVAVEGLVVDADHVEVLAVFDKPDPLEGPYFEETIYVTPSRLPTTTQDAIRSLVARAVRAVGLTGGPIHAEVRVDGERLVLIELAARTIGGLCARTLRFGAGISLEELVIRHALGLPLDHLTRESAASGVMMLPIPREGVLEAVHGQDAARAVPGITGLEITVPRGRRVVPLPEGDRYLGFLFARGETPGEVEDALRRAHASLDVELSA